MDFVKKNDKVISLGVFLLTVIFVFILTRTFFLNFADEQKLLGGFIKFFFLASIGDFIGARLRYGYWTVPHKIIYKAIVWGFIGVVIAMVFPLFNSGVLHLQTTEILPFVDSAFFTAFFTSLFMNVIFAPTMMAFHRISDEYLDGSASIKKAVSDVNWSNFFETVILKTIPLFWIPAHTITFLLSKEYQVIFAAVLGIALGLLLNLFKK